jgi:hypothetical protein
MLANLSPRHLSEYLLKNDPFADAEKAGHYLSLAGQTSPKAGALQDARRSLGRTLAHQQTDATRHAQTLVDLACAERGLADSSAAIAHLQDAVGVFVSIGIYSWTCTSKLDDSTDWRTRAPTVFA